MIKFSIYIFFIVFISVSFAQIILHHKPQYKFSFINFTTEFTHSSDITLLSTGKYSNYKTLLLWARHYNMSIQSDKYPIKDNIFHYLNKDGTCLQIKNLLTIYPYYIIIDFVRFKNTNYFPFVETAQIYLNDKKIKEISFGQGLEIESSVIITLTPNFFPDNQTTLCIRTEKGNENFFGIWDIIVSKKLNVIKKHFIPIPHSIPQPIWLR